MNGDKVHLLDLRLRTSAAGNPYLSGWLGKAAVVGFRDREADGEVWNILLSTPAPKPSDNTNRPTERSPFTQRPRQKRASERELSSGEVDDRVDDLGNEEANNDHLPRPFLRLDHRENPQAQTV